MATTTTTTVDVAAELARLLRTDSGLRVFEFVADTARPPCVVLGQPSIDYTDQSAGFCAATWAFPVTVITARTDAVAAQREMSRMLADVVAALAVVPAGIFSIEPLDARPVAVTVSGAELPGYQLNVRVRA